MKISFIRYERKGNERFIIRVQIPESVIKPVILKYKNIPSIFMRRDGFTNGATYKEIIEMSVKSKNTQYDILISDKKYEASNFKTLREFYASHNNGKVLTEKALQSMDFIMRKDCLQTGPCCSKIIIRRKRRRFSARYSQGSIREVRGL